MWPPDHPHHQRWVCDIDNPVQWEAGLLSDASRVWQPVLSDLAYLAPVALYKELVLYPKPGLVSLVDSGSHTDMTAHTFIRSIHALRSYFTDMVRLGAGGSLFAVLQDRGLRAEADMQAATGGINTHRGGIFLIGMLCAAAGLTTRLLRPMTAGSLRHVLLSMWGDELLDKSRQVRPNHGYLLAQRHGLRSAAQEAALGFPAVFEVGLPALQQARDLDMNETQGLIHTFMTLMHRLDDTNLVHRGGMNGLVFARQQAAEFLANTGAQHPEAIPRLHLLHQQFVERRLSPGGCADVLAACWLVDRWTHRCSNLTAPVDRV